jgi:hypothetical protein
VLKGVYSCLISSQSPFWASKSQRGSLSGIILKTSVLDKDVNECVYVRRQSVLLHITSCMNDRLGTNRMRSIKSC